MRITSKGQVTIPGKIREKAGLLPHTEADIIYDGNAARIIEADRQKMSRGARLAAHMRGRGNLTLSTDDIMALTRR